MLITVDAVLPGFFDTLRIPMFSGRDFSDTDQPNTVPVAVINSAMAKHFWPNENAIGKRFTFFGDQKLIQVVGVVANATQFAIGEVPQPEVYLPLAQYYTPQATLQVRTANDPRTVLASVREQVQNLDKSLAITGVFTIGELLSQGLWAPRMAAALLSVFGLVALVLAAIGIYGVMAYSIAQRTREVGIRMALGAQPGDVVRMVMGQGLRVIAAGVGVGIIGAVAAARLLSGLLFGISALNPATYLLAAVTMGLIGVVACYIPARRAVSVDPLRALRWE